VDHDLGDEDVTSAATHILLALDEVQEKLAAIRKAAERLMKQQQGEATGDAPKS